MHDLVSDVRGALRGFRRAPAFTLVAVLSLALAIGANGFAFGLLSAVVLRPLPVSEPSRLYEVRTGAPRSGSLVTTSYPAFQDLRQRNTTFSDMVGIYAYSAAELRWRGGLRKVRGLEVTGNYFDFLGVQPARGRFFHEGDERGPGSAPFVVLSDGLWRTAFGAEPGVVGTAVTLDDEPFTVVGVAPEDFHGTERFSWPDYWVPLVNKVGGTEVLQNRSRRAVTVLGRLKEEATPEQAASELGAITAALAKEYPKTDKGAAVRLIRPGLFGDDGEGIRRFLYTVNVLALLLLAAVSVNLASAFAARAVDRSRELAVRVALGSTRLRLVRQLLTEALVTALLGGLAGLACTSVLLAAVNEWQPPFGYGAQRLALRIDVDPRVYLAGLALTVGSALVFGLVPVHRAWTGSPLQVIKDGPADSARRRISLQDLLLVAQIALCTLLVTASPVAVRGMMRAVEGAAAGFRPQGVMLASMNVREVGLEGPLALEKQKEILETARAIPGVTAVGAARQMPLSGGRRTTAVYRPGTTEFTAETEALATHVYPVSPGYLEAAGTRLQEGRDVSWHDAVDKPAVALVNETFARTLWGATPPIGQRFVLSERTTEVVGVVEDGKYHDLMESPAPAVFVPLAQHAAGDLVLVVRSPVETRDLATALLPELRRVQPHLQVTLQPWPEALASVLFPARAASAALGLMGLLSVVLAITGVFGMAAHGVSRRVRELGIRMALGAPRPYVLRAAVGRPAVLLAVGSATGLLASLVASRHLGRIVYQADPSDPAVLIGAVLTMAIVGVSGSLVPALRALAIEPSTLMRND